MNERFDGALSVQVSAFHTVPNLGRFFTADGKGYTKTGPNTCCDDWSLKDIPCDPRDIVFVKEIPINKAPTIDELRAENERLRNALEKCRLLAAKYRSDDWVFRHILRFCDDAGIKAKVTR